MSKIVTRDEFITLCGTISAPDRDTSIFNGNTFKCVCGKTHTYQVGVTNITHQIMGGKGGMVALCKDSKGGGFRILIRPKFLGNPRFNASGPLGYAGLVCEAGMRLED